MATNLYPPGDKAPKKKGKANPFGGKETVEEESAEHGVELDGPLESHKGLETPEEEAAEELEIEEKYGEKPSEGAMSPRLFVDEVRSLLEQLDAPKAPSPRMWSMNEKKLPF